MAQVKSFGRLFVVYGRDPLLHGRVWGPWVITFPAISAHKEWVVEGTDWEWDELHRSGEGFLVRFGGWCFGVGAFEKGLSSEMLDWIEDEAVWLDDVEPGQIGRWAGSRHAGAERLGYEYVPRRTAADQDPAADPEDV